MLKVLFKPHESLPSTQNSNGNNISNTKFPFEFQPDSSNSNYSSHKKKAPQFARLFVLHKIKNYSISYFTPKIEIVFMFSSLKVICLTFFSCGCFFTGVTGVKYGLITSYAIS